jgi:hypothetical protein
VHFLRRLEITLAMRKQAITGLLDGGGVLDAREHILQCAAFRNVIVHIVGRDKRDACVRCKGLKLIEIFVIVRGVETMSGEGETVVIEDGAEIAEGVDEGVVRREDAAMGRGRDDDGEETGVEFDDVVKIEMALAFFGATLAAGEEAAEVGVGGEGGGEEGYGRRDRGT